MCDFLSFFFFWRRKLHKGSAKKIKNLYLVPKEAIEEYLLLATQCADFLAKLGTGLENDFVTFSSPPVDLLNFFRG